MELILEKQNLRQILLYLTAGLAAGFINGLAGTGAGVVFLLLFGFFGSGMTKTVFGVSMACVIPLSFVSLATYPPPDTEILPLLPWIFLFAVSGGFAGAWLQKKVPVKALKYTFALLVIWAGLRMLF